MVIYLKDRELHIPDKFTVGQLLQMLGKESAAVWVNKEQIFYNDYATHTLIDQDSVLIYMPLGGG